jgi:hypothetical protein
MQLLQKIYLIIFMATAISSVITPVSITYAQSTVVPGGEETGGTQSPTNVAESIVVPASASPAPKGVYTSLVNLPGLTDNTNRTLAEYVNVLFRLAIGIGALIAVVKIIVAGIKYMASDAVFSKEEAKKDIQNALLGLLIMLSTVVILRLINKDLLNIDVFQALQPLKGVELTAPQGGTQSPQTQQPGDLLNPRPDPVTISKPSASETAAFQQRFAATTTIVDSRQYTYAPGANIGRDVSADIITFTADCRARPGDAVPQIQPIRDEFSGAIIGTNAYCVTQIK